MNGMTCEQAMRRILDADRGALDGTGDSGLARHLRSCDRCAAAAAALARELAAVDHALSVHGDAGDPDAAAAAALAASRAPVPVAEAAPRPRDRRFLRAWVPLAAAAALAALLLVERPGTDPSDADLPPAGVLLGSTGAPRLAIRPPADRRAAIMETANPNITIVWLYQEEEEE